MSSNQTSLNPLDIQDEPLKSGQQFEFSQLKIHCLKYVVNNSINVFMFRVKTTEVEAAELYQNENEAVSPTL